MATASRTLKPRRPFLKYLFFTLYGALMLVVWFTRDHLLLQPNSELRLRYAPLAALVMLHGLPAAIALFLGIAQFSSRIRQRHLAWHRLMGRIYVGCVAIAAPAAVIVAVRLPLPTLLAASVIQAAGWMLATGTALYCVRSGQIQRHREWMMRSYPFAMVFVFVRAIAVIPAVARSGPAGFESVVWSCIATAGLLPSFFIEWQHLAAARRTAALKASAATSRA